MKRDEGDVEDIVVFAKSKIKLQTAVAPVLVLVLH